MHFYSSDRDLGSLISFAEAFIKIYYTSRLVKEKQR